MRTLIVTAIEAEAAAIRAASPHLTVHPVGVGIAAAAAGTSALLTRGEYAMVISAGIAGGFAGRAEIGEIVIGTRSVAPEFGAESATGFLPIDDLGFGSAIFDAAPLAATAARTGDILTVQTVTGTAASAAELARRWPHAVAEAMEGFGVATAASRFGVPFAEVRGISNLVGPRHVPSWRIKDALAALTIAFKELG